MKDTTKPVYRTTAEIRARITELNEREQRLRRGAALPRYRQRSARLQMRAFAESSAGKTVH